VLKVSLINLLKCYKPTLQPKAKRTYKQENQAYEVIRHQGKSRQPTSNKRRGIQQARSVNKGLSEDDGIKTDGGG